MPRYAVRFRSKDNQKEFVAHINAPSIKVAKQVVRNKNKGVQIQDAWEK